jgi:CMP-N-acetylneuraminic acid synthetase
VGLVYPDYYVVNERGDVVEIVRRKKIGEEDQIFDLPAHGACTMIRRECLVEVGGYTEEFSCQDGYDLWLKMIARFKPYNVNVPLFYYRRHGKNLTGQSDRILTARGGIKRRFIETQLEHGIPRTLGLVPAVGRSIYAQSDPFVEIAGKPLIWYTLSEVVKSPSLERIVVSSDDERVLEYAAGFERVTALRRPDALTRSTTRMEDVAREVLDELKAKDGYEPEAVCTLYINTPLRRAEHIDRAVHAMTIFKTDSVVSVQEELAHMYRHRRFGLAPVTKTEGELRLEREALYSANGAIYLSKASVIRQGRLLGKRVGHIVMLPEESIKTNSEFDLWLAERVIAEWKTAAHA